MPVARKSVMVLGQLKDDHDEVAEAARNGPRSVSAQASLHARPGPKVAR